MSSGPWWRSLSRKHFEDAAVYGRFAEAGKGISETSSRHRAWTTIGKGRLQLLVQFGLRQARHDSIGVTASPPGCEAVAMPRRKLSPWILPAMAQVLQGAEDLIQKAWL